MSLWLGAANSLIALGSAVFGVLALIRPEVLKGRGAKGGALGGCGGSSVRRGTCGHGRAAVGLRSGAGSDGGVEGVRLYAAMYAGRAIPLGLAVSAVVWIAPSGRATVLFLGVAAAAQIADVVVALANRLTGMAVGAAIAALLHAAGLAAAL